MAGEISELNAQLQNWSEGTGARFHAPVRGAVANTSMLVLLLFRERRVEGHQARLEIEALQEFAGFGRAVFAVHAAVFPFDRERALVADPVQRADDLFEVDPAAAW